MLLAGIRAPVTVRWYVQRVTLLDESAERQKTNLPRARFRVYSPVQDALMC